MNGENRLASQANRLACWKNADVDEIKSSDHAPKKCVMRAKCDHDAAPSQTV